MHNIDMTSFNFVLFFLEIDFMFESTKFSRGLVNFLLRVFDFTIIQVPMLSSVHASDIINI